MTATITIPPQFYTFAVSAAKEELKDDKVSNTKQDIWKKMGDELEIAGRFN